MKTKTIRAVEAYKILKELKVAGMSDEAMLAVWKNLKALRPISENYDKDIEEVRTTLQDKEFEAMQQRVVKAQEVERRAKEEDRELTDRRDKRVVRGVEQERRGVFQITLRKGGRNNHRAA